MNDPPIQSSQWTFGINDPSFIAWLIFAVYFVTAFLCWRASGQGRPTKLPGTHVLWMALSLLLILLGFNKQLDLHSLMIDLAQDLMARRNDSPVLVGGVLTGVGVLGVGVLLFGLKHFKDSSRTLRWTYATMFGLLGVQVLRFLPGPISGLLVTHVFTKEDGLLHIHTIELLELGSLILIGLLARVSAGKHEVHPADQHDDDQRS